MKNIDKKSDAQLRARLRALDKKLSWFDIHLRRHGYINIWKDDITIKYDEERCNIRNELKNRHKESLKIQSEKSK